MKINVDWLREPDFDEKYYTRIICIDGSHRTLDSWTDERDILEISERWSPLKQLELKRYYTPSHMKWLNDSQHRELRQRIQESPHTI